MSTFHARYNGHALVPSSAASQIAMEKLPRGVPLKVDAKQPRNPRFHRLYFALINLVANALSNGPAGGIWDADDLRDDISVAIGHATLRRMTRRERTRWDIKDGAEAYVARPKSISFAAMDEAQFGQFVDATMAYIRDDLAPWIEDAPEWADIAVILRESHMLGEAA